MSGSYQCPQLEESIPKRRRISSGVGEGNESNLEAPSIYNCELAPVYRLPKELLHKIFVICAKNQEYHEVLHNRSLWLFFRVCKKWKEIAQSPIFWRTIKLFLAEYLYSNPNIALTTLRTWLGRSKDQPLSISISFTNANDMPGCAEVISMITSEAGRWKYIGLSEISHLLLAPLRGLRQKATPMLEHLSISLDSSDDFHCALDGISFHSGSPELSNLFLDVRLGPDILNLQFLSLESLSLVVRDEILPVRDFVTIITKMPSLAFLYADLKLLQVDDTINLPTPTLLPNLKAFQFNSDQQPGGPFEYIFDRLTLPSLEEVSLWACLTPNDSDARAFLSIVNRSQCHLKVLSWPGLDRLDERRLNEFFSLSSLEDLMLTDYGCNHGFSEKIMRSLTYSPQSPTACRLPRLTMLQVYFNDDSKDCDDFQLAKMIQSRRGNGADWPGIETAVSRLRQVWVSGERPQVFDPEARRIIVEDCDTDSVDFSFDLVDGETDSEDGFPDGKSSDFCNRALHG